MTIVNSVNSRRSAKRLISESTRKESSAGCSVAEKFRMYTDWRDVEIRQLQIYISTDFWLVTMYEAARCVSKFLLFSSVFGLFYGEVASLLILGKRLLWP